MDVFQQNWTEQMKSDVFVNKLLNTNIREVNKMAVRSRIHMLNTTPFIREQKYKFTQRRWNQAKKRIRQHKKYIERNKQMFVNPPPKPIETFDVQRIYSESEQRYHNNTRPQSLYNLRYACIR